MGVGQRPKFLTSFSQEAHDEKKSNGCYLIVSDSKNCNHPGISVRLNSSEVQYFFSDPFGEEILVSVQQDRFVRKGDAGIFFYGSPATDKMVAGIENNNNNIGSVRVRIIPVSILPFEVEIAKSIVRNDKDFGKMGMSICTVMFERNLKIVVLSPDSATLAMAMLML